MRHVDARCTELWRSLVIAIAMSLPGVAYAGPGVWTSGGPYGGSIPALAIDPTAPTTLYAGTDGSGVFRSTNSGGWAAANTGLPANLIVYALAIDPTTSATLYAGTSGGVFKSTDSGGSWAPLGADLPNFPIRALALDPTGAATLYAGLGSGSVWQYGLGPTDLSVTLTDSPDPVTGLDTVTYVIGVSNAGPEAASNVVVVQSVTSAPSTPPTFQSASGSGWGCVAGTTQATCTRSSLASGATAPTLTIQWQVGPAAGTLDAQAVVSATEADPSATNNTATASTTVTGMPYTDLSISQTDGGVTVLWNGLLTYTLTASNAGPGAVTGAPVSDSFPASVTAVAWTCSASPGSSCPASGSGNIGASVNLAVGGTATFTAAGRVVYGTAGPIANTATVSSPIFDTNSANNNSTINTAVNTDLIFKDGFQ